MSNPSKKDHAMETLNVGTLTKNQIHAGRSAMAAAKAPKTTLSVNKHANTNAKIQLFKKVNC